MAIITKKKLILKEADSQSNSYIVIHNSDYRSTNKTYDMYEKAASSKSTKDAYTHYIVDDTTIIQCLKDNWPGSHTAGEKPYKDWGVKGLKDGTINNSNSIGITVIDDATVDFDKSTENLIELVRWIMKNYNIPLDNVVRHGDTAYRKCPLTIVENNKWDYIKKQIKTRNDKQQEIKIDFSDFDVASDIKQDDSSSSSETSTTSSGSGQVIQLVFHDGIVQETLSNANTSDNWVDMHRIKGITLHMHPPYHNCTVKDMPYTFKYLNWDRTFHYKVDYDTKIDFDKKPVSGKTRGGNDVGTSRPDVDLVQGEGLYSGVVINGYGGGGDATSTTDDSTTIEPSGEVYGWPLPKLTRISSGFGPRICPYHGKETHYGIDIPADSGTEIHAYANGKVTESKFHSSYGNYIVIDHGGGCSTKYAHQSKRLKEVGDTINAGDIIGKVGSTGSSTGNHLHFELHLNNKAINPTDYVKPGGGSKKIPDIFNTSSSSSKKSLRALTTKTLASNDLKTSSNDLSITTYDLNDEEDYIVYDNIDKGTICFASEENGQHTYIERALFNNQHQKYTLSIAEFFDPQETALEKDTNYDYPKTEKKLIEQCAKALYDEGFSSNELWREFDINRAPSPFLYLDREKWILFLEEVQKQVDWLNEKYGKVTATYVPNNLLTNENTNEFIDVSPDLGINWGTGGTSNTGTTGQKIDSLQGTTMIGDSRTVEMKDNNLLNGIDVYAKIGMNACYFYNKKTKVNRLSGIKNSTKAIIIWLGTNNPEYNIQYMKDMLDYLKSTYSSIPIYVIKEFYVAKGSTTVVGRSPAVQNKYIDKWNNEIGSYCSSNGINFVDFTSDFNDGDYGKSDLMQDGVHYKLKGYNLYLKNLANNITTGNSNSSSSTSTASISTNSANYTLKATTKTKVKDEDSNDSEPDISEDITADKDNIGKLAYVDHDTNVYIYTKADTASKKIRALTTGEEVTITGAKDKFYQIKIDADKGYVRAKNLSIVMSNKYGNADSNNIGKKCWTKFENTVVYKTKDLDKKVVVLEDQARGKILEADKDLYYIKFTKLEKKEDVGDGGDGGDSGDNKKNSKKTITPATQYIDYEGWVKAYRITTDWNYFDYEKTETIENPYDSTEIEIINGDFEGNSSSEDSSEENEESNNDNTENTSSSKDIESIGWSKYGKLDYNIIDNPAWDENDHWNYRGDHYARIRSAIKATTGLTNDITISKVEQDGKELDFYVRFTAWIKQVTQDDIPNSIETDSVETIMKNGITFALLDKDNKIKFSQKLEIPSDVKKFGKVSCVFSNVPEGDYKLFIGSKDKYDIFLDDVTGEQIYNIDPDEEEEITTGNIGISGVGTTSVDNGGIMAYSVGKPKNPNAKQPEIKTIITTEEYEEIMQNANPMFLKTYLQSFEPYDKGLDEVLNAPVMQDDRLNTLTETIESFTGNDIHYNVIETGPGSTDHCVKPADELNVLYKQVSVKCDPIYPDLIVPPNYSTSDYDNKTSDSTIPLQALQSGELNKENLGNKKLTYDYDVLEDKKKESKGKPINYNDAYPYDSKITELEKHYPKVSIDEIESRLYSCNHPGCPIAHPMAKNFAMLNDMQLAQSKRIEQRLTRIENISSVILRNLGRLGSRMNINCVYYGGQDIFGKYKTIRCTHDDRIHDGCSVTIDQCLCCTRYEPIIGQIYDILDETGMNGSALLDDMQMSYMTLDDLRNLNQVEKRSSSFDYANVSIDEKQKLPKSLIDTWKELDKEKFKESLKSKYSTEKEQKEALEKAKESDYVFQMDWTETELDGQAPDVKKYPSEGLTMKYYKEDGDSAEKVETTYNLDTKLNKDVIEDIKKDDSIANGEWVDTREEADTTQSNKYTSEDFYFENFNKNRTGYEYDNGLAGYIGLTTSGAVGSGLTGAECRNKIVEKAKEIVQLHKDGKAFYSNTWRTIDDTKRQTIASGAGKGMYGYDCSSMASCCYKYAGLTSLYNKNCAGGTVMAEIVNNGGEMWLCNESGLAKAMPGDCVVCCGTSYENKFKPTEADMKNRKKLTIYHIMIYIGNNQVAHASTPKAAPNGIRIDDFGPSHYAWNNSFFIRPKDLIEADKAATNSNGYASGNGVEEKTGTIDGNNYVCILRGCKCTRCEKNGPGASGMGAYSAECKALASHNMPYGTKVYFPKLKGKPGNTSGIYTVTDTGNAGFDFDIYCTASVYNGNGVGNERMDAYILEWGPGNKVVAPGHKWCLLHAPVSKPIWNDYKKGTMATLHLTKFTDRETKTWKVNDVGLENDSALMNLTDSRINLYK